MLCKKLEYKNSEIDQFSLPKNPKGFFFALSKSGLTVFSGIISKQNRQAGDFSSCLHCINIAP
jgi:hypothetical protein